MLVWFLLIGRLHNLRICQATCPITLHDTEKSNKRTSQAFWVHLFTLLPATHQPTNANQADHQRTKRAKHTGGFGATTAAAVEAQIAAAAAQGLYVISAGKATPLSSNPSPYLWGYTLYFLLSTLCSVCLLTVLQSLHFAQALL